MAGPSEAWRFYFTITQNSYRIEDVTRTRNSRRSKRPPAGPAGIQALKRPTAWRNSFSNQRTVPIVEKPRRFPKASPLWSNSLA